MTTATLTVEHGDRGGDAGSQGAVHIPKNMIVAKFLDQCKHNPNVKKRLKDNPQLLDSVVDAYIGGEIERLFAIRNAALPRMGKRAPYAGPQWSLHSKMFGMELSAGMARVLGPYALTNDAEWGLEDDIFEVEILD